MNINFDKFFPLVRYEPNLTRKIAQKLALEFTISASPLMMENYERKSCREFSERQMIISDFRFEDIMPMPLYAHSQLQVETAFSWIAPLEFYNGDVIEFYCSATNYNKNRQPDVHQIQPFVIPKLPKKSEKDAKEITLLDIAIQYRRHIANQEKMFAEWQKQQAK